MRIAIDARMCGNEECTGIGTYIKEMTKALFEIDKKNEYLMFLREPGFSKFTPPNERVKKALVTPRWYTYAEQIKLPLEMAREKFDLIHYPHFNSPILFPKKSVCTIHDITPLFYPGHKMGSIPRRLAYRAVFSATLHKARQIIAVSESTKQGIIDHFKIKSDKITVIYEGVDERFKIIADNGIINETKTRFGITKPYIFYIGVWREHKNIESLVKAFNLLKQKYKIDHQLVLAGREDLHYTNVREEIDRSSYKNDILTPGYITDSDLPILYNAASCFALPSFIEGFGLIAIEAQKCGCPVAVARTSSLPEILGDSALFFDPEDVEEIADKIYQVLTQNELQKTLIAKGQENVKRYSWQNCAKETLAVYKNILKS